MNVREELLVNQVAQGKVPKDKLLAWFESLSIIDQRQVLRDLNYMAMQAKPSHDDAVKAVEKSGLKVTYTPCALLLKQARLEQQTAKITNLPDNEVRKAFLLLLALFEVADLKRYESQCKQGCNHWWHRDLSDADVVSDILRENA